MLVGLFCLIQLTRFSPLTRTQAKNRGSGIRASGNRVMRGLGVVPKTPNAHLSFKNSFFLDGIISLHTWNASEVTLGQKAIQIQIQVHLVPA